MLAHANVRDEALYRYRCRDVFVFEVTQCNVELEVVYENIKRGKYNNMEIARDRKLKNII